MQSHFIRQGLARPKAGSSTCPRSKRFWLLLTNRALRHPASSLDGIASRPAKSYWGRGAISFTLLIQQTSDTGSSKASLSGSTLVRGQVRRQAPCSSDGSEPLASMTTDRGFWLSPIKCDDYTSKASHLATKGLSTSLVYLMIHSISNALNRQAEGTERTLSSSPEGCRSSRREHLLRLLPGNRRSKHASLGKSTNNETV